LFIDEITSVGAVDAGDNPEAAIMFFKRKFSTEERDRMADKGQALPSGGYPIATASDLRNAISAFGRARNPAATKAHIIRRARALGLMKMLPEGWITKESRTTADSAKGGSMERPDLSQLDDDVRSPIEAYIDELESQPQEVEQVPTAELVKSASPEVRDLIEKQATELAELRKSRDEDRERLETAIAKARLREFTDAAARFPALFAKDEAGPRLAEIEAAVSAETYAWLEERFAAAQAVMDAEGILKEVGRPEAGDRVEALVKAKRDADPELTVAQARAQVWRENPDLVEEVR
jgi:hypothetical protein